MKSDLLDRSTNNTYSTPEWTESEIQLALELISHFLPDVSVEYQPEEDTGIHIGDDNVIIHHAFLDYQANLLDVPVSGEYAGIPFLASPKPIVKRHVGKVYNGYELCVCGYILSIRYKTLVEAVNAAVVAYETLRAKRDLDERV